ncbi:hypothetical protein J1N35_000745 [Gossypium stocksii]|uniref:RNase H type-1 domain-containing protein n=1 Tax=Gossypium stocksii TaxID=47602 RepID=A0A9D3WHN2_9ROSI|nr:hypothetical protein J1N35_000745 [Gossypium stocksii]
MVNVYAPCGCEEKKSLWAERLEVSGDWKRDSNIGLGNLKAYVRKRSISDHCPIVLLSEMVDWGPRPFKFYECWMNHRGFKPMIAEKWKGFNVEGRVGFRLKTKLKLMKDYLKQWNMRRRLNVLITWENRDLFRKRNFFDLLVESDSMSAISRVNKKDDRPWKLWRFFNELDLLVNHTERVEFVHIFREANSTADFFD